MIDFSDGFGAHGLPFDPAIINRQLIFSRQQGPKMLRPLQPSLGPVAPFRPGWVAVQMLRTLLLFPRNSSARSDDTIRLSFHQRK